MNLREILAMFFRAASAVLVAYIFLTAPEAPAADPPFYADKTRLLVYLDGQGKETTEFWRISATGEL